MRKVIGIGETVFDIIFKNDVPQAAVPGGSSFNSIISLGRAGVPCCIVTETGHDHIGDITCKYLRDNGVDDRYVTRRPSAKSHVSLAFLNDKNDAQYQFYKDHASACISKNCPEITDEDIILFGSFFAVNPAIRTEVKEMLENANEKKATIYYDINFRASHIADIPYIIDNIKENMKLSSIVRGSLEDFEYLYGRKDKENVTDEQYVDQIYEKHISPFCKSFICTNGGKSIELRTPTIRTSFPVKQIVTISTIGAGDNFNAGFIYSLRKTQIKTDLSQLSLDQWSSLIATGQLFSSDVCQQLANSISEKLVNSLKAGLQVPT